MSSERYDEAVREQKKAERKKQVQKQVMILVIALVVIAVAAAAVFFTIKGKKSEPKDTTKTSGSGLAGAISASYETFASKADPDASAEDVKKEAEDFAAWIQKTYPDESSGKLQKAMKSGKVSAEDFYSSYGKTLHVLSDEYKGYLGYTLGKYDETGDLSQMLSEQILSAMTGADALFLNQEFSISSKGEALSGKTSILHANAERMNILEALGADIVSLGNEHAAGYGQDALKENMELLKNAGMAYVGAGTDAADAAQPAYLIINGIKIGFTSASGMEDSYDMAAGDGKAGILEYTEAEQYTKVIQEAATKCDYLIVYDHEGKGDANGVESYQKEHAAAFLQAGADIVIGGHSDRLQGIEYIDGKPVVYSIGSVLTDGTSRYSAVLKLNITSEGLKEMSLVPGIQTEDMTEYLDSAETQKKMYDAVAALCPNASIDENGVVTEKK